MLDGLPPPVSRWLRRAIEPGAPLRRGARLEMHGTIKVGRWMRFTARQVLAPSGFVWAADAGRFPLRIRGFDRCTDGTGEMRWKLGGLVPVMTADDDNTYRSSAGRLAGEAMLLPGAALGDDIHWSPLDDERAVATVATESFTHQVTVRIDDEGALRSVSLPRWGNPDRKAHREVTFGVEMGGELRAGGQVVPTSLNAGWWFGTDRWAEGEFFRATIDAVETY